MGEAIIKECTLCFVLSASELTELLTEVLAEQGVDLESAGYPKELAQQLEIDAREQIARQDRSVAV